MFSSLSHAPRPLEQLQHLNQQQQQQQQQPQQQPRAVAAPPAGTIFQTALNWLSSTAGSRRSRQSAARVVRARPPTHATISMATVQNSAATFLMTARNPVENVENKI